MRAIDLLIVVPPHGSSMVNGPPMAPMIVESALAPQGVRVAMFDANARFFRWFLRPDVRASITGQLQRLLSAELDRAVLERSDLTRVGRLLTFLASDYCSGNEFVALRSSFNWGAAHEVVINAEDAVPDRAFRAHVLAQALDHLADEIAALRPRDLAFSALFHTQLEALVGLSTRLRDRGFAGKIILGGAAIKLSEDPYLERLMRDATAELAYKYDLYDSFPSLAGFLAGRVGADGVDHATFRDPSGGLRTSKSSACQVKRLVGPMTYDVVDSEVYFPDHIYPVLLSEGCYWGKCDFCDYPFLASQDPFKITAIFRDPEHVVADISTVVDRFGVRKIDLISDAVPMGYFARLARAGAGRLRARGVELGCSIRAEPTAEAHHFAAMAECGVDMVTIGVEAVCDDVLAGMKKGNTFEDIVRAMEHARAHGIRVKANLIYDHPRIQERHVGETLTRLSEIRPYIASLGVHSFGLTPHAPLAYEPESANLVILRRKNVTNDHGQHHLEFRRSDLTPQLAGALEHLRTQVESVSYALERESGGISGEPRVLCLPFRWDGDRACRDAERPDLMVEIPSERAPFSFFVGEHVAA